MIIGLFWITDSRMNSIDRQAPLFSIVVPIYGVEAYLPKCLDSILSQSFSYFETILVDDGSKDRCPQICDEYAAKDNRIKVVHKVNGGLVSARQAGVEVATGEYVVCVDGDDWIGTEYLRLFANLIYRYKVDVIVCGHKNVRGEEIEDQVSGWKTGLYNRQQMEKEIFPSLIQTKQATYFPPTLWGKTFKKSIYYHQQLVVPFVNMGEDGACTIPAIYHADSLYVSDTCEYFYRINQASMTNSCKPLNTDGPRIIHYHLLKQLDMDKFDFREQLYRKTVHELFSVVKSQFYKRQNFLITRREIVALVQQEPYKECVEKCAFNGSMAATLMVLCMRYHLFLPVYLFSKLCLIAKKL